MEIGKNNLIGADMHLGPVAKTLLLGAYNSTHLLSGWIFGIWVKIYTWEKLHRIEIVCAPKKISCWTWQQLTFPSTSSFIITAGGSSSPFPFGILDKSWQSVGLKRREVGVNVAERHLLAATTLLMKSAILVVTTDVVPSSALSRICPPIPSKVRVVLERQNILVAGRA